MWTIRRGGTVSQSRPVSEDHGREIHKFRGGEGGGWRYMFYAMGETSCEV